MEREMINAWIKEIENVASVWMTAHIENNFLVIDTCYRNRYIAKPSQILTIRKIDEAIIIKSEGGFIYIDLVENRVTTGI